MEKQICPFSFACARHAIDFWIRSKSVTQMFSQFESLLFSPWENTLQKNEVRSHESKRVTQFIGFMAANKSGEICGNWDTNVEISPGPSHAISR